ERGRVDLARRYVPRLLHSARGREVERRAARVDAAADLLVPPFSVLAAATVALVGVTTLRRVVRPTRVSRLHAGIARWCLVVQVGHMGSVRWMVRAPWAVYRSLLGAPWLVLWKLRLWRRVLVRGDEVGWLRTARNADAGP